MPELKHTFTGGKMEKDLDERIVPNGQYREALNISVATSEDSNVGAAQNILGNIKVTSAIQGRTQDNTSTFSPHGYEHINTNHHIAEVVDPQSDMLYRFVATIPPDQGEGIWMDRIVEYNTTLGLDASWQAKEQAVMVDIYKVQCQVTESELVCTDGNKTKIKVDKNLNQIRWGMRLWASGVNYSLTVENVDYVTGWITLDSDWQPNWAGNGFNPFPAYFIGDRNLNFDTGRSITGLNIIDGMIFWTDNHSEPKKVNIKRGKEGCMTKNFVATPGLIGRHSSNPPPHIDNFNQHTVLIVDQNIALGESGVKYDCYKDETICPIYGCTDGTAFNYDPNAQILDNSCCFNDGCMDPLACDYDETACWPNFHTGCCYVTGCMDPNFLEYDPDACCDDGSCQTQLSFGCYFGYQVDECSSLRIMGGGDDYDVFDSSNQFPAVNLNPNTTPAINSIIYALDDDYIEFMRNNELTTFWSTTRYVEVTSNLFQWGANGSNFGGPADGNCTYFGHDNNSFPFTLQYLKPLQIKYSDFLVRGNSWMPNYTHVSGHVNPTGVESPANYYATPGVDDDYTSIITWLRNTSIFDGTFVAFEPDGLTEKAVPAVTTGMSWLNVRTIVEDTYSFQPQGQDGPIHNGYFNMTSEACNCSNWIGTPTCSQSPDDPANTGNPLPDVAGQTFNDMGICGLSCPPTNWSNPLVTVSQNQ